MQGMWSITLHEHGAILCIRREGQMPWMWTVPVRLPEGRQAPGAKSFVIPRSGDEVARPWDFVEAVDVALKSAPISPKPWLAGMTNRCLPPAAPSMISASDLFPLSEVSTNFSLSDKTSMNAKNPTHFRLVPIPPINGRSDQFRRLRGWGRRLDLDGSDKGGS
jgi:hypothetical protein